MAGRNRTNAKRLMAMIDELGALKLTLAGIPEAKEHLEAAMCDIEGAAGDLRARVGLPPVLSEDPKAAHDGSTGVGHGTDPGPADEGDLPEYVDPTTFMDKGASADHEPDKVAARVWVMRHMGSPAAMLKPEACPNSWTWQLLLRARRDPAWFIERVYQGLKPSPSELQRERKRFTNDQLLEQIKKVEAEVLRLERESAVDRYRHSG